MMRRIVSCAGAGGANNVVPLPIKKDVIRRMIRDKNAADAIELQRANYQKFGMKYPRAIHIAELAEREQRYQKIIMKIHEIERFYLTKPVPLIIRHNLRNNIENILDLIEEDEPELIEICLEILNEYGAN